MLAVRLFRKAVCCEKGALVSFYRLLYALVLSLHV